MVQATYEDLAQKLYSAPTVKDSRRFSKPKLSRTDFTIEHYAGEMPTSGPYLYKPTSMVCLPLMKEGFLLP